MDSIVTYIEREQRTFIESPVNPVDSLVFSSLCYFNFDQLVLKPELTAVNCLLDTHTSTPVLLSDILALCEVNLLPKGAGSRTPRTHCVSFRPSGPAGVIEMSPLLCSSTKPLMRLTSNSRHAPFSSSPAKESWHTLRSEEPMER